MAFKTMYSTTWREPQKFSPMVKIYKEIKPGTFDKDGNILNKNDHNILIEAGEENLQEKIQSYADSVDIYKMIEKFILTGDESYINNGKGAYMDLSSLPDNINDFQDYKKQALEKAQKFDSDLANNIVVNQGITDTALDEYIQAKVKAEMAKQQVKNNEVVNEKVESEVNK